MRNEIYVGALISERELEHSSGSWKKHKYLKKIGDKYIYAKNKIGDATGQLVDKVKDLAWDAQFEAEYQAERAADAAKGAVNKVTNPITGSEYKQQAANYQRDANTNESVANDLRERAKQTAGEQDKRTSSIYNRGADEERRDAARSRREAEYYRNRYNKTLGGKLENAIGSIGKKVTRTKRLKESVKDTARRSEDKKFDSRINARKSRTYRDAVISKQTNSRVPGEEASLASYYAKKSRSDARASTTLKRVSAARQSELERNSIKQRSERAKKRVAKALGRFKKKK